MSHSLHQKILAHISLATVLVLLLIVPGLDLAKADDTPILAHYVSYEEGRKLEVIKHIEDIGGEINHDLARWDLLAVSLPVTKQRSLNDNPTVLFSEPVPAFELADEAYPFGLDMVQALDVWDFDRDGQLDSGAPTGNGIKVCIIDTGVFDAHKDFAATIMNGVSQIKGESWNETINGHGTHVAGTVAANMQGHGLAGVAPEVELFIIKVYDSRGNWIVGQSNIAAAAATCADIEADIINLSLKGEPSLVEEAIFQSLFEEDGILTFAAAANDGNSSGTEDGFAYPASYDSVVSVAAITSSYTHADYSNENVQVELAAPGSAVISTWPTPENGSIPYGKVIDNDTTHTGMYIENSAQGSQSSTLIDGGFCREADQSDAWNGQIVLCQRQDLPFSTLVDHAEAKGAVATIIAWKEEGLMVGSLGAGTSTGPVIMVGKDTGDYLRDNKIGTIVTVETHDGSNYLEGPGGYRGLRGTSMASPHAAGVAALIWSVCPDLSNQELRQLLAKTALDLGPADWDFSFGYGLVQAFDAWHHCQPADSGDLQRSYGQARHTGDGRLRLGQLWGSNSWQGQYPGAGYDDQNDDGITFSELNAGQAAIVNVQANGQAQSPWINGWLDYDRNGRFSSSEAIFNDPVNLNQVTQLTLTIPVTVNLNFPINYRFRLYDKAVEMLNEKQNLESLPMTVAGGEVEDGMMFVIPTAVSINTFTASQLIPNIPDIFTAVLLLGIISTTAIVAHRRNKKNNF